MGKKWDYEHSKFAAWSTAADVLNKQEGLYQNALRGEEAFGILSYNLGRPGTYDPIDYGSSSTGATPASPNYVSGDIFSDMAPSALAQSMLPPPTKDHPNPPKLTPNKVIDPQKVFANELQSPQYRMLSYMTAEADQLVRQTGPMYQQMRTSLLNPIIEGGAQAAREQDRSLIDVRRASGGAQAGLALEAAMARQYDESMTARNTATSNAILQLKMWSNDNARSTMGFAQDWIANEAGVRQSFQQVLYNSVNSYSDSAIRSAQLHMTATRNLQVPKKQNGIAKMVLGGVIAVAGVALSEFTGGASLAAVGPGLGMMGGGMSEHGQEEASAPMNFDTSWAPQAYRDFTKGTDKTDPAPGVGTTGNTAIDSLDYNSVFKIPSLSSQYGSLLNTK